MAIFFVRLNADDHSARSIAFDAPFKNVKSLTKAFFDDEIVAGYRCEWRWLPDRSARAIVSRSGLTLSCERIAAIEEPHIRFVEEDDVPEQDLVW